MHECLRCINDETVGFHRNEDDTLLICNTDNHKARYIHTGGSASLENSMDYLFLNCPKKRVDKIIDPVEAKDLLVRFTCFFEACEETCFDDCVDCFLREEFGDVGGD